MKVYKRILSFLMVFAMIFAMVPFSVYANEEEIQVEEEKNYPSIVLDEEIVVSASFDSPEAIFSFVPEESGFYVFHSYNNDYDTYAYLYDEEMNELTYNDDGAGFDNNFKISYELTAGEKYYFMSRFFEIGNEGVYSVELNKCSPATSMGFSEGESATCYVGIPVTFNFEFYPANAVPEVVVWTFSDPDAVTQTEEGQIIFLEEGEFTITATSENDLTASCVVTVEEPIVITEEQPVSFTACKGSKFLKFTPSKSETLRIYAYNLSNADSVGLALYDSFMGMLKESVENVLEYNFEEGQTYYITAFPQNVGEEGADFSIGTMELVAATSMSIDKGESYSANIGESFYLKAVFSPDNAIFEGVTWESNAPEIATVDENGWVNLLKAGEATITATSENNLVATCKITVEDYPTIALDESASVEINDQHRYAYFYFTPEEEGYYCFSSDSDQDTYGAVFDSDFNELAIDDDSGYENNFKLNYQMEAGTTYILRASFLAADITGNFSVKIEKARYITALEILSLPEQLEYMEGNTTNIDFYGLSIRATWSDGSTTDWSYGEEHYIEDQNVVINAEDIDESGKVTISCGGKEVSFNITIIENPVDHIELVSGTTYKYIENGDGYIEWEGSENEFFYYYSDSCNHTDAIIKIVYKDDSLSAVEANVGESVDEHEVRWYSDQYGQHWVVGENNQSTIEYMGHTVNLPITVVENPVDHIELVSGTSYSYIENCNGYIEWEGSENEFFYYNNDRYNHTDVVIRIVYKDGRTSVEANVGDMVDEYVVDWYSDQYNHPWAVGEDNKSTIEYMDHTVNLPITVKENPVESIELVSGSLTLVENTGGYEMSNGYIYDYEMPEDVTVKINYIGGTSEIVNVNDEEHESYKYLYWYSNQEEKPWSIGDENYITIHYLGFETQLPVTIVENPVDHIELVSGTSYSYTENYNGFKEWEGSENEFFYYYAYQYNHTDAVIRIIYKDEERSSVEANVGDTVDGHEIEWYSDQYNQPWVLGDANKSTIEYLGHTVNLPITVEGSPVESIELVSGSITMVENSAGNMVDGVYYYDFAMPGNVMVKVNFSDKPSVIVNVHETVDGYSFDWYSNQAEKPWTLGNDNYAIISFLGAETRIPVTIIENPVDHIELMRGTSRTYIENNEGHFPNEGEEDFYYYHTKNHSDAVIKIVYKDLRSVYANVGSCINGYYVNVTTDQYANHWTVGNDNYATITYLGQSVDLPITVEKSTVESIEVVSGSITCIENAYGYEEDGVYYYNYEPSSDFAVKINYAGNISKIVNPYDIIDGYSFEWDDDQYENPWTLGDDNYITLSYLGAQTQVSVSVIENPVERIEINSAPTREYIYGDSNYGYFPGEDYYEFYPSDTTGLSFTVYYKNQSPKTFTHEDIDENGYIDGYGYGIYCEEWDNPSIGNVAVTFEYMGKTDEFEVVLKESPIDSIEITKLPDEPIYADDEFFPALAGMEITITYANQTKKVVTLTEENIRYHFNIMMDSTSCEVEVDGEILRIEQWGYGLAISYMGLTDVDEDIVFEDKAIETVSLSNVTSADCDGATIDIVYSDKTTETLTLEVMESQEADGCYVVCNGKTEKGILDYWTEIIWDDQGNADAYMVWILGQDVYVDANPPEAGDADLDGEVDMKDATILRRYLVGGYDVTVDPFAIDMNNDRSVTLKDVTLLCRALLAQDAAAN